MDRSVCFVGLKCYDLLVDAQVPRFLGGVERQLVALGRGLASSGWRVAFVTYDHGQPAALEHQDITIYKSFLKEAGLPGLRFVHPRMTKVWSAMKRANTALYVQMGAGSETGTVAAGSRRVGGGSRRFVYCVASNADCVRGLPFLRSLRERSLYRYGLRRAHRVVSQTREQHRALRESFQVESDVIPMGCGWLNSKNRANSRTASPRVLWVGRITPEKRLEWLFDVAGKCREVSFDVVGTPNAVTPYSEGLEKRGKQIPNVMMHGKVSDSKLAQLYDDAGVLCCTSVLEGFPTTFLEAWSHGIPVVSTFDPDNTISERGLGRVVTSPEQLTASLRELLTSRDSWTEASRAAREYFFTNHTVGTAVSRFETLFDEVLEEPTGGTHGRIVNSALL